jgi:hypothetical protein
VNPILQAISNRISAMPAAASAAPPVPAPRGGFASTLAAAQGLSNAPRSMENRAIGSSGLLITSTKNPTGLRVNVPPGQAVQAKKPLSNGSAATDTPATGAPCPIPLPEPNLSQLSKSTAVTSTQNVSAPGTAQSEFPSVADTKAQNTLSGFAVLTDPLTGTLIASQVTGQGSGPETLMTASATVPPSSIPPSSIPPSGAPPSSIPPSSVPPSNDPRGPWNGSQACDVGSASNQNYIAPATAQPELLTAASAAAAPNTSVDFVAASDQTKAFIPNQTAFQGNAPGIQTAMGAQPGDTSITAGQVASGTVQPDTNLSAQWNGLAANGLGAAVAQSIPQGNPAVGSTEPGPMLVAKASFDAAAGAGVLPASVMNPQGVTANSASVIVPETGAQVELNVSAQTAAGSLLSETMNGQNLASSILNVAAPLAPGVTGGAPNAIAPAAGPGAGAPIAVPASASASSLQAASDPGSGIASQTPFSVFFSGSGPGTESAASVLPKMILPATGSAGRSGHATFSDAPGSSPQINNAPSGVMQNAPPQNNSNNKDPRGGSASASLTSQPMRPNGDPGAGSVQAAAPSVPAPPPASTGVTLSPGGQPPPAAELPKASPQPAFAPDVAARAVPWAPEQAAVVPGPVQVAQLVTRMGQSEMRIGMNTSAFGNVEVRTVVHASDVGLIIGSEKGDLRTLLANEIPVITHSLQQQNLRLNSVNFMQGFAFSNNASGGSDSQPQSFVPMRAAAKSGLSEARGEGSRESVSAAELEGGHNSLSILA